MRRTEEPFPVPSDGYTTISQVSHIQHTAVLEMSMNEHAALLIFIFLTLHHTQLF